MAIPKTEELKLPRDWVNIVSAPRFSVYVVMTRRDPSPDKGFFRHTFRN